MGVVKDIKHRVRLTLVKDLTSKQSYDKNVKYFV